MAVQRKSVVALESSTVMSRQVIGARRNRHQAAVRAAPAIAPGAASASETAPNASAEEMDSQGSCVAFTATCGGRSCDESISTAVLAQSRSRSQLPNAYFDPLLRPRIALAQFA